MSNNPQIVYAWRDGYRSKISAQTAGEELTKLEAQHGHVHPKVLAQQARSKKSPFHPVFEWNDRKCGKLWREDQARKLLSAIRVKTIVQSGEGRPIPVKDIVFVHANQNVTKLKGGLPRSKKQPDTLSTYIRVEKAMRDPVTATQVLEEALTMLKGLRDRYGFCAALLPATRILKQAMDVLDTELRKIA